MPLPSPASFRLKTDYDLVIVGSGGASMCAALAAREAGLEAVILEKPDGLGGSTGLSGGLWWVPDNAVIKRLGVVDSPDLARTYMDAVIDFSGKGSNPARREAFIREAPRMIDFLEREGMQFTFADGWSDYYDDRPGGQPRGRALMAEPFDLNRLGPWADKLSLYAPSRNLPLGSQDLVEMFMFRRSWKARGILAKLIGQTLKNKLLRRDVIASGGAIQSRMLEMALERDIPIFTGCATDRLIVEDGRVVGVGGSREGEAFEVRARRGVLLNCGGFARNQAMRDKYQNLPVSPAPTNANPGDTGEMIEEAIRIGADTENLDVSVWVLTSLNPDGSLPAGTTGKDGKSYPFMHNADIVAPHLIIVDGAGRRFMNEGASYVEQGETILSRHAAGQQTAPSFAVFDQRHWKRYFWGSMMPGTKPEKEWLASGFLVKADSIRELAAQAGIDAEGLEAEVTKFNAFAREGVDRDFGRGERAYDRWRGDPRQHPNPCLGEIAEGPFYAIRIFPADVGTYGGLVSDEHARVLRLDGSVIEGLYAAGNCTSSVMGRAYPGAGASIAASFAFGYIAAKAMAESANGPHDGALAA